MPSHTAASDPPLSTSFTELVGIAHPIVQDAMGPHATDHLAAAVSNAGGLGTVSTPGRSPEPTEAARIFRERIDNTVSLTSEPFAANVPTFRAMSGELSPVSVAYLHAVIEARGSDSALERGLRVVTTSGGFPSELREAIRDAGLIHIQKVGSTRQAKKAEDAGVEAIIAAGYEMGGHTPGAPVNTFVLVPNVTESVDIPVLLSGGARDGRSLAAALCLGADGVAMGTRFIAAEEHRDWDPRYAQAVLRAREGDDIVLDGGRVLRNRAVERLYARKPVALAGRVFGRFDRVQRLMTRVGEGALLRAQRDGEVDRGIVAAGQVASAIREIVRVADFVPSMAEEAARILDELWPRRIPTPH
ncbi:MAG TPA: nitronate monooxygenase family protein [Actinomycetota bacterium]|nr:nitronate monooxygenase family protein [Actinomycetota bacterium]